MKQILRKCQNFVSNFKEIYHQTLNFRYLQQYKLLEDKILHSDRKGITDNRYCEYEVIVSLTSHGKRMYDVCYTIESIMQQTMLPNRIILNVAAFDVVDGIPLALQKQCDRGLEICVVEDVRSYNKLIPTLKKYLSSIIITVDDDVLYDFDVIERLFKSYKKNSSCVSALRTHTIQFDKKGKLLKYSKWGHCTVDTENPFRLFPTGVGGVLYPPKSLHEEVFNQEVFTSICPTADDIWFHAMAVLNGTEIVKVPSRNPNGEDYILNEAFQDTGLWKINTGKSGQNDIQIKAVYERYGIYNLIK